MNKKLFKKMFEIGKEESHNYMVVSIETEGNPEPEYIINSCGNFDQKFDYYMNAYDDDMELIKAKEHGKIIKIKYFDMIDDLDMLPFLIKTWEE